MRHNIRTCTSVHHPAQSDPWAVPKLNTRPRPLLHATCDPSNPTRDSMYQPELIHQIPASHLPTFHARYGSLLKASMASAMRKRDKKKEKARAEAVARRMKEVYEDVELGEGGKRGKGRRQRVGLFLRGEGVGGKGCAGGRRQRQGKGRASWEEEEEGRGCCKV